MLINQLFGFDSIIAAGWNAHNMIYVNKLWINGKDDKDENENEDECDTTKGSKRKLQQQFPLPVDICTGIGSQWLAWTAKLELASGIDNFHVNVVWNIRQVIRTQSIHWIIKAKWNENIIQIKPCNANAVNGASTKQHFCSGWSSGRGQYTTGRRPLMPNGEMVYWISISRWFLRATVTICGSSLPFDFGILVFSFCESWICQNLENP